MVHHAIEDSMACRTHVAYFVKYWEGFSCPCCLRRLLSKVDAGDTMPVYHDLIGTWKPQVQSLVCNLKCGFCRATCHDCSRGEGEEGGQPGGGGGGGERILHSERVA